MNIYLCERDQILDIAIGTGLNAALFQKAGGIFAFSIDETSPEKSSDYEKTTDPGIYRFKHPESGLYMYRHTDEYIRELCRNHGFMLLKKTEYMAFRGTGDMDDFHFSVYLCRKSKNK